MRALSSAELLAAWEAGLGQDPPERALALLAAAWPGQSLEALQALPLGQRDDQLLRLREWTFGPVLTARSDCPRCQQCVEFDVDIASLLAGFSATPQPSWISLRAGEVDLRVRAPNSGDLAALRAFVDANARRRALLVQCVQANSPAGVPVEVASLPDEVIESAAEALARADPHAEIELMMSCPACGHAWPDLLDIVSYFWSEIEAWALRTLREVHVLARTYGWSEQAILQLSPARRQAYLEMACA